jgi:energy-coupling factor transport system permease protein
VTRDNDLREAATALDARVWLIWTLAASIAVMLARNPLYTVILLLAAQAVTAGLPQAGSGLRLPVWRFGLAIVLFSALFNAAFVHDGARVLFRLPEAWPLIGGQFTVESLVFGAANGLLLVALLAVFNAFNTAVPAHELVWLFPGALGDLGVVVLVAMTYVPATLSHWRRIRDAQAIRGHRTRSWRDWRPLAIPLLVGGLERAVSLSEAMVSRGYGATAGEAQAPGFRLGLFLGLLGLLIGWFTGTWYGTWGYWLMAGAAVGLLILVWHAGRGRQRTRYRTGAWRKEDTLLALISLAAPAILLLPGAPGQTSLSYSPYPALTLPSFHPAIGILLALLAAPAFLLSRRSGPIQ